MNRLFSHPSMEETLWVVGFMLALGMVAPVSVVAGAFGVWLVYNGSGWPTAVLAAFTFAGVSWLNEGADLTTQAITIAAGMVSYALTRLQRGIKTTDTPGKSV